MQKKNDAMKEEEAMAVAMVTEVTEEDTIIVEGTTEEVMPMSEGTMEEEAMFIVEETTGAVVEEVAAVFNRLSVSVRHYRRLFVD